MNYITATISREKLGLKEYSADSIIISDSDSTKQVTEREFLTAAVELLALICLEARSRNDQ